MSPPSRARSQSLAFKLVASGIVSVVVIGLLELGARALGPQAPAMRGSGWVLMGDHETRLWGIPPGVTQSQPFKATINDQGFRGPVPEVPKPADTRRMLLVGDSTFFGHGVDDGETLADHIPKLFSRYGVEVEVVNFGVPGYSTYQTAIQLEEQGWALEPDVLLMGNLWSDNDFSVFADADLLETRRAFDQTWWGRSSLLRLLAAGTDRLQGGSGARIVTWTTSSEWPEEGVRRVPLQQYARNLDGIISEARDRGVATVLIQPCNRHLIDYPDSYAPWTPYFKAQRGVAKHHGLPLVSACDAMDAVKGTSDEMFMDAMHFSERGNRVVGEAVAKALLTRGWPFSELPLGVEEPFDPSELHDMDPSGGVSELTRSRSPQSKLFSDGSEDEPEPPKVHEN